MALQKRKKWFYGDAQADIREVLEGYSKANGYAARHFADLQCECGGTVFHLLLDEDEGVALRACPKCEVEHFIGDSEEFAEEAELSECECKCGSNEFELMVGVSLYEGSRDVRWIYIGCRCPACSLTATYADWKNEFGDYEELLRRV